MMHLLAALAGCGPAALVDAPSPLDRTTWVAELVLTPPTFAALTATDRSGWIALHAHGYEEAAGAFTQAPHGRARAAWQLVVLHDDLARLSGRVHDHLFTEWGQRSGLPAGSAAPTVAVLASACAEGDPSRWASAFVDAPISDLAKAVLGGQAPWEVSLDANDPWAGFVRSHATARFEGAPPRVVEPVLTEPGQGFERRFFDPCLHRTARDVWSAQLTSALGSEDWRAAAQWAPDVGGRVFSAWLTPEDLLADLSTAERPGLVGATLPSLGLAPLEGPDDPQAARAWVQSLDAALGSMHAGLVAASDDDGRALLAELGLLDRFRGEVLTIRARAALLAGRPHQARVLLQWARDATQREVGPTNGPHLFALLAEAELATGRTREALDALEQLARAYPETRALIEVTGDLAVLRGLDRQGDSREE